MDAPSLPTALDAELDDVLSLLPLVDALPRVGERVFSRLVDVLARAALHDVAARYAAGELDRTAYLGELCDLVAALREQGILVTRATGPA